MAPSRVGRAPAGLRSASPELSPLPSLFPLLLAPGALAALPGEEPGAGCGLGKLTPAAGDRRASGRGSEGSGARRGENWGTDRSLDNALIAALFPALTCRHKQGSLFERRGQVKVWLLF